MDQIILVLAYPADIDLEDLLTEEAVCRVHPGTTLDGDDCAICAIDDQPRIPAWVARAVAGTLPAKVYS